MSTSNADFAKTLDLAPHLQEQAAAFADAKGLSLAGREVVAEDRGGKLMLIVTADAAMSLALKAGRNFAPVSTEWTADGKEWADVWISASPPVACRVTFEVEGIDRPVVVVHTLAEYTQGRLTGTQRTMPALMLSKATMQLGLRRIAPQALAGLYSQEEAEAAASGEIARAEHAEAVQDAVTPASDADAKGATISRAEQYAARREELVTAGKSLRADHGAEAAQALSVHIKSLGADVDKLTAAHLKSILAQAAAIRKAVTTPPAEPDPVEPEPAADPSADDVAKDVLADAFDGEFVI